MVTNMLLLVTISQLRVDTVSQVLTMANVRAGNKMVVMETCQGLLIGATLERMGGVHVMINCFLLLTLIR